MFTESGDFINEVISRNRPQNAKKAVIKLSKLDNESLNKLRFIHIDKGRERAIIKFMTYLEIQMNKECRNVWFI